MSSETQRPEQPMECGNQAGQTRIFWSGRNRSFRFQIGLDSDEGHGSPDVGLEIPNDERERQRVRRQARSSDVSGANHRDCAGPRPHVRSIDQDDVAGLPAANRSREGLRQSARDEHLHRGKTEGFHVPGREDPEAVVPGQFVPDPDDRDATCAREAPSQDLLQVGHRRALHRTRTSLSVPVPAKAGVR